MATSAGTRQSLPPFIPDEVQHRRAIAAWMRQANAGHLECTGTFTLTANQASTSVVDARAGGSSFIGWTPTTANASAEIGNGTISIKRRDKQVFTVKHANNAQADRTFLFTILG